MFDLVCMQIAHLLLYITEKFFFIYIECYHLRASVIGTVFIFVTFSVDISEGGKLFRYKGRRKLYFLSSNLFNQLVSRLSDLIVHGTTKLN